MDRGPRQEFEPPAGLLRIEDCLDSRGGVVLPPGVTLISLIERNVANVGDSVAYRYLDHTGPGDGRAVELTWTQLGRQLRAIGARVQRVADRGDRVAILAPQGLDYVAGFFAAIKAGRPTPELLAYQYLQTLPEMAKGEANKVWLVPSDFGSALQGFTKMLGAPGDDGVFRYTPSPVDPAPTGTDDEDVADWFTGGTDPGTARAVAAAEAAAAAPSPTLPGTPPSIPGGPAVPPQGLASPPPGYPQPTGTPQPGVPQSGMPQHRRD